MSSILLLEDDEELGEALRIYLQKAGYEIRQNGYRKIIDSCCISNRKR